MAEDEADVLQGRIHNLRVNIIILTLKYGSVER